ncbi:response regulator transcription factor [Nocardioides sp. zg-1228]|uniref:response regulator n=1 Tax=Nocardioides sp. zg-1228 TaxID=2763008 RepID=UPI001F11CD19|nr:response regulator transcription factor [Nocardioides sp. zg-1228]
MSAPAPPPAPLRVVVAEDETLVRDGLVAIVAAAPDLDVVGTAADGEEAVAAAQALLPDVVLMDVRMPRLDGVGATRRIVGAGLASRVLVLTTVHDDAVVAAALREGASGFLLKSVRREQLWAAVRAVHAGDTLLAPDVTRRLVEQHLARPPVGDGSSLGLTPRQADVVRLVARGLSNAEVAARLHLAESTVKGYLSEVLVRHGLRDRTQVVVLAYESGLVAPGDAGGGPRP